MLDDIEKLANTYYALRNAMWIITQINHNNGSVNTNHISDNINNYKKIKKLYDKLIKSRREIHNYAENTSIELCAMNNFTSLFYDGRKPFYYILSLVVC